MTQTTFRPIVIGTAGHVDHGKTTLIAALTGTNTDRLAEEQARGMTIDLGFATLPLPGDTLAYIVDVPGHERFVKNMLAGAGGVDLALLVVAADDGPMPQTREHVDILTALGIRHAVVALTRADLADPELVEIVRDETRALLQTTPFPDAPIVTVSAVTGAGLDDLVRALGETAARVPRRNPDAPARLPVDRVFSVKGVGTVVTGTLVSGTLRVGDELSIEPQGLKSRARSLQSDHKPVDDAVAGTRVAVQLPGIETGAIERGAVVCAPGSLTKTRLLDVKLDLVSSATRPLRHRERVRAHLGTGEILGRVHLPNRESIDAGERDAPAQLVLETDAAPARGERFVLRTYSPQRTIGGGIVVDPSPPGRFRRGDTGALDRFSAGPDGDVSGKIVAELAARHEDRTAGELSVALGIDPQTTRSSLETLADSGKIVALTTREPGGLFLSIESARRVSETARRTLAAFHKQNPFRQSMPKDELRIPLAKAARLRDFSSAVAFLLDSDTIAVEGTRGVRLPEHAVVLSERWRDAADRIADVHATAQFSPPSPGDFSTSFPRDIHVPTVFLVLTEQKTLVKIAENLYLHETAWARALSEVRRLARTDDGITVGGLRDAIGSSRKLVLPLLEKLDGLKITRRVGEKRVLATAEPSEPDA